MIEYHVWVHSSKIGKLGFLDSILNTPSNHRVHHSEAKNHQNKNLGSVFMIWDRIFGTYKKEEGKIKYGIGEKAEYNIIKLNFGEYYNMFKDAYKAKGIKEKFQSVLDIDYKASKR